MGFEQDTALRTADCRLTGVGLSGFARLKADFVRTLKEGNGIYDRRHYPW